jgi:hypothetical protein
MAQDDVELLTPGRIIDPGKRADVGKPHNVHDSRERLSVFGAGSAKHTLNVSTDGNICSERDSTDFARHILGQLGVSINAEDFGASLRQCMAGLPSHAVPGS